MSRISSLICASALAWPPLLAMPSGCAPQVEGRGAQEHAVQGLFAPGMRARVRVLFLDPPRWIQPSEPADQAALEMKMLEALLEDTHWHRSPEGTESIPGCQGFCWIIVNGTPRSLVLSLGGFGFAVGPLCTHSFTNPSLARALRRLFRSAGLMSGYRGRYLDYCLRVAAGERPNGSPLPTEEEQQLLDEEESEAESRLRYQLGRGLPDEGIPSESAMLARAKESLAAGADVNAVVDRETGNTALHQAALNGYWNVVQYLLLKGADPNVVNPCGETPLHLSVRVDNRAIVSLLLIGGAKRNAKTAQGLTPLHVAAERPKGATGMAEILLKAGANLDEIDEGGATPLIVAVGMSNKRLVKLLCQTRIAINRRDKDGFSALLRAGALNNKEISKDLLSAGAEVDIFAAAALGILDRVRHFLKQEPSSAKAKLPDGDTPLHFAAANGHVATVQALIDAGAPVDAKGTGGFTALHLATRVGSSDTVMALLAAGAPVNARNDLGLTPLDIAAEDKALKEVADILRMNRGRKGRE